jgi:O-antigen ligase
VERQPRFSQLLKPKPDGRGVARSSAVINPCKPKSDAGQWTAAILMAGLAGIPLALVPSLFLQYYTTPKLVISYLAAALLLLRAEDWWPGARALWRTSCGRLFYITLLAQIAWLCVSTAFSRDLALALGGTTSGRFGALTEVVVLFIIAVMAAHASLRPQFVRRLMMAIEASGGIAGLYGVSQYLGFDPLLPARLYTTRFTADVVRPPATLGHAIYFANFLLPVILIAAWFVITEVRSRWRWLHGGILSIGVAAMALTGTRSALLGLITGGALLAYIEARRIHERKIFVYSGLCTLAGFVLISAFVLSPAGRSLRVRLSQWFQDSRGGPRLMVWRDSWPLIEQHWLTGVGPEGFAGEFRKIQSLELSRAYPDHYHEDPHNIFIGVAATRGLPGFGILAALIALGVICGFQLARRGVPEGGALLASLVAVTVSMQFSPLTIPNWLYFYSLIALLAALAAPRPQSTTDSAALRLYSRVFLSAGALVTVTTAGLYLAQDALVAATGRRLAGGDLDGARQSYGLVRRFPFSSDSLWCSQQMASLAKHLSFHQRDEALRLAKAASTEAELRGEQKFNALYQSAVLALITNDFGQAEARLRKAVDAAPHWYRPRTMLASVLWLTGRSREAEEEGNLALGCAGVREAQVRLALERTKAQDSIPFFGRGK